MVETGISGQGGASESATTKTTVKPERNVLIATTGSVATIKMMQLISELSHDDLPYKFNVSTNTLPTIPILSSLSIFVDKSYGNGARQTFLRIGTGAGECAHSPQSGRVVDVEQTR